MTREKKLKNLTPKQRKAMIDLYEATDGTTRWKAPEYLDAGNPRILSTLVCYGLVDAKQIRAARRTDYRLTDDGIALTAPMVARVTAWRARKAYQATEESRGFSAYWPAMDDVLNPTLYRY